MKLTFQKNSLKGKITTDLFEAIQNRRSIRKYTGKQISKNDLVKIIEAGLYAPNAGGGQRTIIYGVQNKDIVRKLGAVNFQCFDSSRLAGGNVSAEQPSIIDDPSGKDAFYGAPTVIIIFAPKIFLYSEADSFCCAQNMALAAYALGVSSCIVARARETFAATYGNKLMREWEIPENYTAFCFLTLGYINGEYPKPKPRKANRSRIIE